MMPFLIVAEDLIGFRLPPPDSIRIGCRTLLVVIPADVYQELPYRTAVFFDKNRSEGLDAVKMMQYIRRKISVAGITRKIVVGINKESAPAVKPRQVGPYIIKL